MPKLFDASFVCVPGRFWIIQRSMFGLLDKSFNRSAQEESLAFKLVYNRITQLGYRRGMRSRFPLIPEKNRFCFLLGR